MKGTLGARLGAGREADVYTWRDDGVIKLYRPGFLGHRAEAAALAKLNGHDIAPKLVDTVELGGRAGLVLERVNGSDMLSLLRQRPWRAPGMARMLAAAHLAVHERPAPDEFPELRQLLAGRIVGADLPAYLRDYALRVLDALPDGDRLCHGDYHPGNVLVAADRVTVLDWPNAARGTPEADHARTVLLLRWTDPPADTSRVSRALIAAGRKAFTHRYARAYRTGSPQRPRHTRSWLIAHAAARLAEGVAVEQAALVGFLDRAQHRAAR